MLILVMGVTGAGKSTLAQALARRLGLPFHDADDFHPEENRRKMAQNIALDDSDRAPWLARVAQESLVWEAEGGAVLACSALKHEYRQILLQHSSKSRVVFLDVPRAELVSRLEARRGTHAFIGDYDRILDGQFRDLEPPTEAVVLPGSSPVPELIERAARILTREGFFGSSLRLVLHGSGEPLSSAELDSATENLCASWSGARRVLLVASKSQVETGSRGVCARLSRALAQHAEVHGLAALRAGLSAEADLERAFADLPPERRHAHDPHAATKLGEVPETFVRHISSARYSDSIPCSIANLLASDAWDRIVSVGDLAFDPVVGTTGHADNVFVGAAGRVTLERLWALSRASAELADSSEPTVSSSTDANSASRPALFTAARDAVNYMAFQLAARLPITYVCVLPGSHHGDVLGVFAADDETPLLTGARALTRTAVSTKVLESRFA
jgi:carbohydrate kinase (thermoresistant glucokinase family)